MLNLITGNLRNSYKILFRNVIISKIFSWDFKWLFGFGIFRIQYKNKIHFVVDEESPIIRVIEPNMKAYTLGQNSVNNHTTFSFLLNLSNW